MVELSGKVATCKSLDNSESSSGGSYDGLQLSLLHVHFAVQNPKRYLHRYDYLNGALHLIHWLVDNSFCRLALADTVVN